MKISIKSPYCTVILIHNTENITEISEQPKKIWIALNPRNTHFPGVVRKELIETASKFNAVPTDGPSKTHSLLFELAYRLCGP